MRSALIITAIFTSVMSLCGAETGEIAIGVLVPPEEPEAASLRDGATLGVEQANESPGPRIKLIVRGRAGQWGADGVEAARMVTDDGARALIAPTDGAASHLVLQVSGRTAVPVVSLCADSSVSQAGIPWMVRVVPRTTEEARALMTGIPSNRWVAVVPDGRAGREISRDLRAAATAAGSSLETILEVNPSLTNATRTVREILTNHPSAVLLWFDPVTAGRLAKALRGAGFSGKLAGPGRLDSSGFFAAAGGASEGVVVGVPVLGEESIARRQRFVTAFRARFGNEPAQTATMSYDAVMFLCQLLRRDIVQAGGSAFPLGFSIAGASGVLDFDPQGNRKTNLHLVEAHDGQFVSVGWETPDHP